MKVPLLDLIAQLGPIEAELSEALLKVLRSGTYVMGPVVEEFESRIASYSGVEHAIGVSSGTDALLIALMALDVGPGDLILTTPHSFFASAGVIARLGATPVFVDIDPQTFNMCPDQLASWFGENSALIKKVKAIIPVHLFGQCADLDPIMTIANKHAIPVVEDAAQAIGSIYRSPASTDRRAGSVGLMGCLSFFPSKNLGGVGDGGMVLTHNSALASKLRKLRVHGAQPKYYHSLIGGNFRLDPIQAAVLSVKLNYLDKWNDQRRANAAYYDEALPMQGVKIPFNRGEGPTHIYNQYVIAIESGRDELREFLKKRDIGTEVYYPVPFHLQECFKYLGYDRGDFPIAEWAAQCTVALPIYPELTREMQDYVIRSINDFIGQRT